MEKNYNNIREYNKLANLVVTPKGSYIEYEGDETNRPTLQEYQDARASQIRIQAANKMSNLKKPIYPKIPSFMGRLFRKGFGDWYDDKDAIFIFGTASKPKNCIYTITSLYPHPVSGNMTFFRNPYKYGFTPISETPKLGDVMQLTEYDSKHPYHAVMVTGFDSRGIPTHTYSQGDDNMIYDTNIFNKVDKDFETYQYYRFVGNNDDKRIWEKDYNKLYFKK